jgi:hypothetical protein
MEALKVKMSVEDQFRCFKYLDKDHKQFLNYHDFCNITVERRRGIDPAQQMLKQYDQLGAEEM